ncbi:histidinol phosphatase [Psychromonas ingrahamii 37]|uniref:Histidinol phosphatase n=1 Tax=Psychromonas ingrahamii (strain DSM 17664 / CCUG 51855 / 37) TaxID=357804 RepID=A1T0H7_PSYIN|nr:hypothetical protein [Psychromonas ingrahamii]ABM05242.1 histidinol phosphatase [Psychromonas ingrahamii 37]
MVTTTRIDSSVSSLGQNSPTSIKSPSLLADVAGTRLQPANQKNKVSGLSKNIGASLALSDSHVELASIDLARQGIKEIAGSLIKIKKMIEPNLAQGISELQPEQAAKIRLEQRKISASMDAQFSGKRVLDSTLNAQINTENKIKFKIEGLDLNRSRWDNELVTLNIDGKISLLMFEAAKTDDELLNQFNKALGFTDISVKSNQKNELILSMSDAQWRQSSKITTVTGQGHRFPSGQSIPTNITAIDKDITTLTRSPLPINDHTLSTLIGLIDSAKGSYQMLNQLRKSELTSGASYLQQLTTEETPFEPKVNTIMTEQKWAAAFNLNQNHATISRKTVVDLLK